MALLIFIATVCSVLVWVYNYREEHTNLQKGDHVVLLSNTSFYRSPPPCEDHTFGYHAIQDGQMGQCGIVYCLDDDWTQILTKRRNDGAELPVWVKSRYLKVVLPHNEEQNYCEFCHWHRAPLLRRGMIETGTKETT